MAGEEGKSGGKDGPNKEGAACNKAQRPTPSDRHLLARLRLGAGFRAGEATWSDQNASWSLEGALTTIVQTTTGYHAAFLIHEPLCPRRISGPEI